MKYNVELELKLVTEQIIEEIQDYLEDKDIGFKIICNEVNEKETEEEYYADIIIDEKRLNDD